MKAQETIAKAIKFYRRVRRSETLRLTKDVLLGKEDGHPDRETPFDPTLFLVTDETPVKVLYVNGDLTVMHTNLASAHSLSRMSEGEALIKPGANFKSNISVSKDTIAQATAEPGSILLVPAYLGKNEILCCFSRLTPHKEEINYLVAWEEAEILPRHSEHTARLCLELQARLLHAVFDFPDLDATLAGAVETITELLQLSFGAIWLESKHFEELNTAFYCSPKDVPPFPFQRMAITSGIPGSAWFSKRSDIVHERNWSETENRAQFFRANDIDCIYTFPVAFGNHSYAVLEFGFEHSMARELMNIRTWMEIILVDYIKQAFIAESLSFNEQEPKAPSMAFRLEQ